MTAGRGIVHSERTPAPQRLAGQMMHGIQSWIALPKAAEEIAPSFQHFSADALPWISDRGLEARLIAGRAFGAASPVDMISDAFYAEVKIRAGHRAPLDAHYEERAIYLVDGAIRIAGDRFASPQLLIFRPGDAITIEADGDCRLMMLGGASMDGPRHIWWNFVSSSKERIEEARNDWRQGRFSMVKDDAEFIPLPEDAGAARPPAA